MRAHPIHRRWYAEDLVRLRPADEGRRYFASQRAGRIDPNPHQVDAVVFALSRLQQGGCILADEVGLGKTIEAGLVVAQRLAEGDRRILLITPKPLLGQWRQELSTLFGIEAREGADDPRGFEGEGVFLVGREYAGGEQGAQVLEASGGFDLCVIDEAHEIFAGIYRRFDRQGQLSEQSRYAKMAARVKALLADTPVLLLTATPIQNSLAELWGLVQYVEPTGTLLGDLPTFRTVFCDADDRRVRPGQEEELRHRIAQVCQRTLRRQAQEFMETRFVSRRARLFEYSMSAQERALYEDVTAYLMEQDLCAFRGTMRRLLLLGFHRRMASSIRALADSLGKVAQRLEKQIRGDDPDTGYLFADDAEDSDEDDAGRFVDAAEGPPPGTQKLRAELARVESLEARARALPTDSKARALVEAVRWISRRAEQGEGTGKLVVFTESLSTQAYLREVLIEAGVATDADITCFAGRNAGPRAREALERWDAEVGSKMPEPARPSRDVAQRLALVHEFEHVSKIFIATEAGAKGLNLQFCENVVNYDLPWNPQRIEQRIGRCHRYGQTRPVTVVNFLATDNEAGRHTFDILTRKLELFGTVLDASDAVLYEPSGDAPRGLVEALGTELQARIERVYATASSTEELAANLREVDADMGVAREAFEQTQARTHGLIETRLDETVRSAFRRIADEAPEELASLDRELEAVLLRFLEATDVPHEVEREDDAVRVLVHAHPSLPTRLATGTRVAIGPVHRLDDAEPLHPGHALIAAAVDEARQATRDRRFAVRLAAPQAEDRGRRGRMTVLRIGLGGFEPQTVLLPVAVFEDVPAPVFGAPAVALLTGDLVEAPEVVSRSISDADQLDAEEEALFVERADQDVRTHRRFQETLERIERYMEDRILVLRRSARELRRSLAEVHRRRDAATGSNARTAAEAEAAEIETDLDRIEAEISRLQARDDEDYQTWRARAHARRAEAPRCERILDLEFELE